MGWSPHATQVRFPVFVIRISTGISAPALDADGTVVWSSYVASRSALTRSTTWDAVVLALLRAMTRSPAREVGCSFTSTADAAACSPRAAASAGASATATVVFVIGDEASA